MRKKVKTNHPNLRTAVGANSYRPDLRRERQAVKEAPKEGVLQEQPLDALTGCRPNAPKPPMSEGLSVAADLRERRTGAKGGRCGG